MKIPIKTRHAIKLMLHLGLNYGNGPLLLNEISRKENISPKYLGQIIIPLKSLGLVNSVRGAHGGYMLNRPPHKISVKQIIEALEGDLNFTRTTGDLASGSKADLCLNRLVWQELGKSIQETLGSITLEDLTSSYSHSEKDSIIYNI